MRVLVTGSAGFIGSHLADALLKEGHEVFGMDNLSVGGLDNVSLPLKSKFWTIDLKDKVATDKLVHRVKPEVVYHCAAWAHEGLSQFSPRLITENNLNIFLNTLVSSLNAGCKRHIVFSSIAAYGNQEPPFKESIPLKPVDIYGLNKATIEETVKILSKVHDFQYVTVRPHNVYGPRQSLKDPYRNVLGIWMNRLLQDQGYYIYGDGEQTRGFSYIDDIIPPLVKLAAMDNSGDVFNIGADKEYSLNELSKTLLKVTGKDVEIIYLADRPAEVKHAYCDHHMAKTYLGFEDTTSLEDGIGRMWGWAQQVGDQKPVYLDEVELTNEKLPKNWK